MYISLDIYLLGGIYPLYGTYHIKGMTSLVGYMYTNSIDTQTQCPESRGGSRKFEGGCTTVVKQSARAARENFAH